MTVWRTLFIPGLLISSQIRPACKDSRTPSKNYSELYSIGLDISLNFICSYGCLKQHKFKHKSLCPGLTGKPNLTWNATIYKIETCNYEAVFAYKNLGDFSYARKIFGNLGQ